MYAKSSSFEANLTLEKPNSFRDVSFSSYLDKAEENMVRSLTNQASKLPNDRQFRIKPEQDEEIDVFGAEKYYKGEIEDECNKKDLRFVDATGGIKKIHKQDQKVEDFDHSFKVKLKTDQTNMHTPSVRSNVSCNSRSTLLPRIKQSPVKIENRSKTLTFLATFGCNCMNKKSTQIKEKRLIHVKQIFDQNTDQFSSQLADLNTNSNTRNDCFSFPVLNPNDLNSNSSSISKSGNLAGKVQSDNNGDRLTLGKKLSLLNDLDMVSPTKDEIYNNDVDSDSSSDLFEIESFSPTVNSSNLGHRRSESNCYGYAPSEVSVDWSVVTASAADFSVVSDYDGGGGGGGGWRNSGYVQARGDKDEKKKRNGVLAGCRSDKAVRVAGGRR
ncbi:hypothetical protein QVD17_31706 [Tagetes erecta]|uniref:Uncharacterized protein n=1 Tax=Tagetes erecta TaxID=13708 RepID=A0AAD8K4R6_TARER|nr:hypothetical protein QVD17_31706 [Tagetes erecta]